MADIERIKSRICNRHTNMIADLGRLSTDIVKLFKEIEERGLLIDTLATEKESLREVRNELASLYDENEPHDMGGPHISLLYVIDKIDEALNLPTNG